MVCEFRVNKKSSYPCPTVITPNNGYTVTYIYDKKVSWWNACKGHKPNKRTRGFKRAHTVVTRLIVA